MINKLKYFVAIITIFIVVNCTEESQIEGLITSDKITVVNLNKEIMVIPNASQNINIIMNIQNREQSFAIYYTQLKNNNVVSQFIVDTVPQSPVGFLRNNSIVIKNLKEGEEIGSTNSYSSTYLSIIKTNGGNNTATNTIKIGEPFYLGFSTDGSSQFASYGWLKMNITNDKITVLSYAYTISKPIKAGEQ